MRRLPMLILAMATLVAMVMGCGRSPRYDSRLTAADSLMRTDPDSALAMLNALPDSAFAAEGDRAYRALLLAQARYKAYVTATSDSDINRALDYYRRHSGEREKLTRAYIYKGAVMEELGHPDSAMFYYKHAEATAEATADPTDYFNLGYTKFRMGALYTDFFSMDGKGIEKYEEALNCLKQYNDTNYLLMCLNNLACLYRESDYQKAENLFLQAARLAKLRNDSSSSARIAHAMAVLYHYHDQDDKAIKQIHLIQDLKVDIYDDALFYCAANIYSRLGLVDSALYYIDCAQQLTSHNKALSKMYQLESLSELALAQNDSAMYLKYLRQGDIIADSLKSNTIKNKILLTESSFDKELRSHNNSRLVMTKWMLIAVVVVSSLVLGLLLSFYYQRVIRYDHLISEIKQENRTQSSDLNILQDRIDKLQLQDGQLKDFITSHTAMMREIIQASYYKPHNKLTQEIKQIINFQDENKDLWVKLYDYIDIEYNGIMKYTMTKYPQLNKKDLLLLALSSLGYSCAQIAIIMGYANATSISGNRQRLVKKMGIDCSLNQYIETFQHPE